MARWLSYFSGYNFVVFYKPGKNTILADALSQRPDYDHRRDMGYLQSVLMKKTMKFVYALLSWGSMQ